MPRSPFIALEIHDASLWEPARVLPIIETMKRWGYNALVLHQNDLLDECTQLGITANFGVSDLRLKKVRNNAAWLARLTKELAAFDAELFLEIKEPSFHDYAIEFYPKLLGPNGQPDPTNPAWAAFCSAKVDDLLARVPDLGGLIVNLSSPESRVSLPDHMAIHADIADQANWFDRMIAAFHEPLAAQGKRLFVRDFSYTTDMQSDVLAAVNRCNGNVYASIKITAHDYFPRFPENPAVRQVIGPTILEFEGFGEHMGWGVIPNCRVQEFRERMVGYRDINAAGFLMRTSWEAIKAANALDTLSAVNVYALPQLADADTDARALILAWLQETFGTSGKPANRAADLMLKSWQIPATSYWNDQVFPRHSCLPSSWQEGWLSMQTSGMGRRDRELGIKPDDPALSDTAKERLFREKEAATQLAERLAKDALALQSDLPRALAQLFEAFQWLPIFAKQFELATKATFFAARGRSDDFASIPPLQNALRGLADQISAIHDVAQGQPHHHQVLFDPEQIRRFTASLPQA